MADRRRSWQRSKHWRVIAEINMGTGRASTVIATSKEKRARIMATEELKRRGAFDVNIISIEDVSHEYA